MNQRKASHPTGSCRNMLSNLVSAIVKGVQLHDKWVESFSLNL